MTLLRISVHISLIVEIVIFCLTLNMAENKQHRVLLGLSLLILIQFRSSLCRPLSSGFNCSVSEFKDMMTVFSGERSLPKGVSWVWH